MRQQAFLSTRDVAKILGVSRQTLYNWLAEGKIAEPARHLCTNHMQWQPQDVQRIQQVMQEARQR
jgi:predicted site-specific integrase-resolvase